MKKFLLLFVSVLALGQVYSQSPGGFQYQAVVRDDQGEVLSLQNVTVQFSILEGSETGSISFQETHATTTNNFGLINLSVGGGSAVSGDFSTIDWSTGTYFIKTEVDMGEGFLDFSTKQLLSVPYALYGEDADADPANEIQELSLDGATLTLSGANSVDLISLQDGTGTDAQELSLDGSNLSISGGNSVDLGSLGTDTDDQTLSLEGSNLAIADGNTVDLSGFLDNTDTQLTEAEVDEYVANNGYLTAETDDQALSLTDNTLSLEDGGSVDLSGYLDNTDTQLTEAEVDEYVANNGYLTAETDDQELSLTDNTLSLEDGGSVDLSAYLDNTDTQLTEMEVDEYVANNGYLTAETDDQALSLTDNTLSLEDGGEVDLSGYLDNTDDQQLILDGTTLTLENGGSVDLSPYAGQNTDSQGLSLTNHELTLQNGGSVDLSPYLDNTDTQNLADVLSQGADANGNVISNLADPTSAQDATTKNYVDANDLGAFAESSDIISAGDENDDFVFGSTQLDDDNSVTTDNARMFFDKSKGAFRAGQVSGDLWDEANVGDNSVVLGDNSQASQYGSIAIGHDNNATASGAIVIGTSSEATTDYAVAIGQYNSATGLNSTALGFETTAIGSNSTTIGNNTIAKSDNELAIGAFNTNYTPAGDNTDRAFVIGNGDYSTTSDAFTVYKNGNALLDGNLSLSDPIADAHATTKSYVDALIASANTNSNGDFSVSNELEVADVTVEGTGIYSAVDLAQSFTANHSGVLTSFDIGIYQLSPPTPISATFTIYEGDGNGGTELYTTTFDLGETSSTLDVSAGGVAVAEGDVYTFRMVGNNLYRVKGNFSDVYDGGDSYINGSAQSQDINFTVNMLVNKIGVTVDENSNMGIGTDTPDASAVLEITSNSQGVLIPRMTTAQRDAISSPASGLLIYNTDDNEINKYNGATWEGETNTDEQNLSNVLGQGADAGAVAITNLADPTSDQDAATKAYVDAQITSQTDYDTSGDFVVEVLGEGEEVDVNFDTSPGVSQSSKTTKVGQSFKANVSGVLTRLVTKISFGGSPSGYTVKLYEGAGYGGTELYSESFGAPGSYLQVIDVTFSTEIDLTENSTYTWAVEGTDIQIPLTNGNPYSGGTAYYPYSDGTWDAMTMTTYMRYRNTPKTAISANDVSVGIGTDSPDASAALDVSSTSGGLLLPRMTTTQRDAISTPVAGLTIFNTTTTKFQGYTGSAWVDLH